MNDNRCRWLSVVKDPDDDSKVGAATGIEQNLPDLPGDEPHSPSFEEAVIRDSDSHRA